MKYIKELPIVIFLSIFTLTIFLIGCGPDNSLNQAMTYHSKVVIESNLTKLQIQGHDTIKAFPHILWDEYSASELSVKFEILPVKETGYIKIILYGGASLKDNPGLSFQDSLRLSTPMDTTYIVCSSYGTTFKLQLSKNFNKPNTGAQN